MNVTAKTNNGTRNTAVSSRFSSLLTAHSALFTSSSPPFPPQPPFPRLRSGHRLFQRPSPQKQIPSTQIISLQTKYNESETIDNDKEITGSSISNKGSSEDLQTRGRGISEREGSSPGTYLQPNDGSMVENGDRTNEGVQSNDGGRSEGNDGNAMTMGDAIESNNPSTKPKININYLPKQPPLSPPPVRPPALSTAFTSKANS